MTQPPAEDATKWRISLRVQVAAFLTLALVPLGIMGILQTSSLREEADARAELRLLALTEAAASGERTVLLSGFGAAEAMSALYPKTGAELAECRTAVRRFVSENERYSFGGFISLNGDMACSTTDVVFNYTQDDDFRRLSANPEPHLSLIPNPDVSGTPVLNFIYPVQTAGELTGFVTLSIPAKGFGGSDNPNAQGIRPDTLILFNSQGEVLTQQLAQGTEVAQLPQAIPLQSHVGRPARTFKGRSQNGELRTFAVTPLVPGVAYAMASWRRSDAMLGSGAVQLPSLIVPFVMWLASLGVAMFAIHRLVLRHLFALRRRMRRFAIDRRLTSPPKNMVIAAELAELDTAFDNLASTVLQDEAEMEDALREKNILLKEIHHRVKNNLQMISSIMNMNLRKARNDETRQAISRLQARVLNLAAVHRQLYMADNLTRADAGALLRSVIGPLTDVLVGAGKKVRVTQDFDEVHLLPDQLLPLSLLAAEVVANAAKHMRAPDGGPAWLSVSLSAHESDGSRVIFRCANSKGPITVFPTSEDSQAGLGTQLISAFARQLGGQIDVDERDGSYAITCDFPIAGDRNAAQVDY